MLINTARGGLVDTEALYGEVEKGRILAGLDVLMVDGKDEAWDTELGRRLAALPNVILTHHEAGNTPEARLRAVLETIGNIKAFQDGKSRNSVI